MKRPLYPLLVCYTIGLIFTDRFSFSWIFLNAIWILLSLSFLAAWLLYFRKYELATIVLLTAFTVLGVSRYTLAQKLPATHLVHFINENQPITLEGWLYRPREEFSDRDRLYLAAEILEEGSVRQAVEGRVRVTVRKVPTVHDLPNLRYGDRLRIRIRLRMPSNYQNPGTFDYKAYLARQGIYLTGSISHYSPYLLRPLGSGGGFWLFRQVFNLREQMQTFLSSSPDAHLSSKIENSRGNVADDSPDPVDEHGEAPLEGGILQAMILGNRVSLSPELQESFRLSGLYHLLVVSGGNIGVLAGSLFILFKFFKILSRPLLLGVIGLIFLYALLTGFEPPVVRASIMAAILLLATLFDRDANPFYSLAASAMIILLIDPLGLFEASFQLTLAATAAILYAYRFIPKGGERFWKKALVLVVGVVILTAAATLGTAPLIIYYFNHFYPYGLLSNIPAVPLSVLILSLGILACIMNFLIPPLAQILLALDLVLVEWFVHLSDFTARLPYADLVVSTQFLVPLLLSYAIVFGVLHGLKHPLPQKIGLISGAVFVILFAYFLIPRMIPSPLRVTFLDVGQGDSAVIEFPDGAVMLIDGGGSFYGSRFDVGRSILAPYLWHQGITKIKVMVISHPHAEHFQGFKYLLEKFKVEVVWSSPLESQNKIYRELLQVMERKGVPHFKVEEGHRQKFGEVEVQILHPSLVYLNEIPETSHSLENNTSLVLKLTYGKICFLFPGDIEQEGEQFLVRKGHLESCTILKAPHHGSATSSSLEFLEALRPSLAVISAGKNSRFGNPAPIVLEGYQKVGTKVYRTDKNGAVRVETDGITYQVKTFGRR